MTDFSFLQQEGLKKHMRDNATCLDFVQFYATDDLASIIVTLTNRYADQYLLANAEKMGNSYLHEWEETNVPKIKTFLGVLLLIGVTYKPQKFLSRNRFYLLLNFFHFNDNEDENYNANNENQDRLHRLRPLIF